jgi:hypothetical protein
MVATQVLNRVTLATSASAASNEWSSRPLNDVICLFDVDGTLSLSRKVTTDLKSILFPFKLDRHSRND